MSASPCCACFPLQARRGEGAFYPRPEELPDHTAVAEALALRAEARLRQGRPVAAEGDLRRALRLREARLGPGHPEMALTRLELASMLAGAGAHGEAIHLLEAAASVFRAAADAPRDDLLRAEALLAELLGCDPS